MAKTRAIQSNFLSGELSPLIVGNVTLQQYYQGLQQAENVLIVPQGGVKRRLGSRQVDVLYGFLRRDLTIPTMPNGGTPANINDDDTATTTSTTTPIGTTNPYVIAQYDLGTAQEVRRIDIKGIKLSTGSSDEFLLQYSDDGSNWASNPGTQFSLNTTESNKSFVGRSTFVAITAAQPHRYWRIARPDNTDLGAATVTLSEFNLYVDQVGAANRRIYGVTVDNGQSYLFIVTPGNTTVLEIFNIGGGQIKNIFQNNYLDAEVKDVRIAVSGNVVLMFHENHLTKRFIFYEDASGGKTTNPFDDYASWHMDDVPYTNVPKFDFNDTLSPVPVAEQQDITFNSFTRGMRYQVEVDGVLSKTISFSGDATTDEQAATEENLRKNLQDMPVFGDTGISVNRQAANRYRITIEAESADAYELFSGFNTTGTTSASLTFTKVATGSPRREPVWSSNRGYPRLGTFHKGRLYLGGTRDKPQSLFGSKSGDLFNFEVGGGEDDEAIFVTISSRNPAKITDVYSGRNLQVFTTGGEFAVLEPTITPATIDIASQTSNGSLNIPVQEVDGAVLYADRNGKTLREYVFSFNEDAYASEDVSVLSSHLIKNPVSMAFLTGTSSDDANWLYIVNDDGSMSVLNKLRSQDINGFTRVTTAGSYKDVTIASDTVFMVVEREINGVTTAFLESLDTDYVMDCTQDTPIFGKTLFGFHRYADQTVNVVVGNDVLPDRTISSLGELTLTDEEFNSYTSSDRIEVGFNFNVNIQPMPANTSIGSGDNFLRIKKIVRANLRVYQSLGLYLDGNPIQSRSFSSGFGSLSLYTGVIEDVYPSEGWMRDTMPIITCPFPTRFHIQALDMEVESS